MLVALEGIKIKHSYVSVMKSKTRAKLAPRFTDKKSATHYIINFVN